MSEFESSGDYPAPPVATEALTPADLTDRLEAGDPLRLLDVRDRDEIEDWRIDGPHVNRTNIPYRRFLQASVTDAVDELADQIDGDGPIVVVCARGEASDFVAGLLEEHGYDAKNLEGGMVAWARVYRSARLRSEPTILQYRRPSSGCLGYMIADENDAIVVDPLRAFVDRYAADADELGTEIQAVVDTHVHADHVSGLRELSATTGATAYMPAGSIERGVTGSVEAFPENGLSLGETKVASVDLPGHTHAMTGFRVADVLLTGDSLFLHGIARPDLETGSKGAPDLAATLYETITDRLGAVSSEVTIAPGHYDEHGDVGPDGTVAAPLGTLRERLPVFELDRDDLVERVVSALPPRPANFERIVEINLGRERADAETAFELELGPNNCAATVEADSTA